MSILSSITLQKWTSKRPSWLLTIATLAFVASGMMTIRRCVDMSSMADVPMPGGWSMSMMWTSLCGGTWPSLAAQFFGMWTPMMIAMMSPSLWPMLRRYREGVNFVDEPRRNILTLVVACAYLFVWMSCGVFVFVIGAPLAQLAMVSDDVSRAAPLLASALIVAAGTLQFTRWRSKHLACCRSRGGCCDSVRASFAAAWIYGLRLGIHCVCCCAGSTAVLLAIGMMNVYVMAIVTIAITIERVTPRGELITRSIGVALTSSGIALFAQAALAFAR